MAGCLATGAGGCRTGDWLADRTGLEVPEAVILVFIARGGIPDLPPEGGGGDFFCCFSFSRARWSAWALHCFLNSVKIGYFCTVLCLLCFSKASLLINKSSGMPLVSGGIPILSRLSCSKEISSSLISLRVGFFLSSSKNWVVLKVSSPLLKESIVLCMDSLPKLPVPLADFISVSSSSSLGSIISLVATSTPLGCPPRGVTLS